jgi:hypothetical protein
MKNIFLLFTLSIISFDISALAEKVFIENQYDQPVECIINKGQNGERTIKLAKFSPRTSLGLFSTIQSFIIKPANGPEINATAFFNKVKEDAEKKYKYAGGVDGLIIEIPNKKPLSADAMFYTANYIH